MFFFSLFLFVFVLLKKSTGLENGRNRISFWMTFSREMNLFVFLLFVVKHSCSCVKLMFHEFIQTEWNAVRQLEAEV